MNIPARLLALLALLGFGLATAYGYGKFQFSLGKQAMRTEYAQAAEEASERARLLTRERIAQNAKLDSDFTRQQVQNQTRAVADRAELQRLRDTLARVEPSAGSDTDPGKPDESGAVGILAAISGECAATVTRLVESGDAVAAQAAGLQRANAGLWIVPVGR